MASEWREVSLSDLADLSGGFAFKSKDYAAIGRFILRTLNIDDEGSISRNSAVYLPETLCPQYEKFSLRPYDTLFVMVGATLGKIGFVRGKDLPALLNQNMWLVRAKKDVADPFFVHYAFRNAVKSSLGWASGSARDFVRRDDYRNIKFQAPSLPQQRVIGNILYTLDEKIELNRRMNETLEAMARGLFKSWFVDFDPVRAKAEGRPTGLPKHIADLFPDSFEDSELGEIPKGWNVANVGELAEVTSGKRPSVRSSLQTDETPVPLWGGNGPMAFVKEPLFQDPILLTGRVGTLGSVFRINLPCWPSDNTLIVLTKDEAAYEFLYFQLRQVDFGSLNRGSTQPLLTQTDLKSQGIILPKANLIQYFHKVVASLFSRIDTLKNEVRILITLRDALLPRLISGELRVKNMEYLDNIIDSGGKNAYQ
jgi:type I restriction enzyme, S subunit